MLNIYFYLNDTTYMYEERLSPDNGPLKCIIKISVVVLN